MLRSTTTIKHIASEIVYSYWATLYIIYVTAKNDPEIKLQVTALLLGLLYVTRNIWCSWAMK